MPQPVEKEKRSLRDFNFESCTHPEGSIAYDRGVAHCPFCGSIRKGTDTWEGGSVDYKIDLLAIQLFGDILKKNLTE